MNLSSCMFNYTSIQVKKTIHLYNNLYEKRKKPATYFPILQNLMSHLLQRTSPLPLQHEDIHPCFTYHCFFLTGHHLDPLQIQVAANCTLSMVILRKMLNCWVLLAKEHTNTSSLLEAFK